MVELLGAIGFYAMTAMTLNAFPSRWLAATNV